MSEGRMFISTHTYSHCQLIEPRVCRLEATAQGLLLTTPYNDVESLLWYYLTRLVDNNLPKSWLLCD